MMGRTPDYLNVTFACFAGRSDVWARRGNEQGAENVVAYQRHMSDLMERLENDARHRDLTILVDRSIVEREFGDWTMIYRDRRESIDAFDDRLRVLLAGVSDETVRHFRALQPA